MSTRATPFGKYLLLQRVNVGGMAEVYKARLADGGDGRIIAIKRILPAIAADQDFISMFVDEAKISVQLEHPHIAATYELGRTNDIYYMAMEYISGRDLRALFERKRRQGVPVPPALAAYVLLKVAEGLDYAHRKKDKDGKPLDIIHRDISPQNVLLSYDGDVKIIDFGIAKAANKILKTQAGILKGKFGYMSPEQVRGLDIDHRSDIFSAGILLHELLTGERLFVGASDYSVLEKVRDAVAPPVRTQHPDVPDELEAIVSKALAQDRDQRYLNASELAAHLHFFLDSQDDDFTREDLAIYLRDTFATEFDQEKRENADKFSIEEDYVGPTSQPSISMPEIRPTLLRGDQRPRLEGGIARPTSSPVREVFIPSIVAKPEAPDSLTPPRPRLSSAALASDSDRTPVIARPEKPEVSDTAEALRIATTQAAAPAEDGLSSASTRIKSSPFVNGTVEVSTAETQVKERPRGLDVSPGVTSRRMSKPAVIEEDESDNEPTAMRENALLKPRPTPTVVATPKAVTATAAPPSVQQRAPFAMPWVWIISILLIAAIAGAAVKFRPAIESEAALAGWKIDFSLAAPGRASLTVVTEPLDAQVLIDDEMVKPAGRAPYTSDHVSANVSHEIHVRRDGYNDEHATVLLKRGERKEIRLKLKAGRPVLTVNTVPPGAHLIVDGQGEGRAGGTPISLEPGEHSVKVVMNCFESIEKRFTITDDQIMTVPLVPLKGACVSQVSRPTDPGYVQLIAHPAAHVFIDGQDTKRETPLLDFPLPPGHHTIRLVEGDQARVLEVDIKAGRSVSQSVNFR